MCSAASAWLKSFSSFATTAFILNLFFVKKKRKVAAWTRIINPHKHILCSPRSILILLHVQHPQMTAQLRACSTYKRLAAVKVNKNKIKLSYKRVWCATLSVVRTSRLLLLLPRQHLHGCHCSPIDPFPTLLLLQHCVQCQLQPETCLISPKDPRIQSTLNRTVRVDLYNL